MSNSQKIEYADNADTFLREWIKGAANIAGKETKHRAKKLNTTDRDWQEKNSTDLRDRVLEKWDYMGRAHSKRQLHYISRRKDNNGQRE